MGNRQFWEKYAKDDPYFAVVTLEQNRSPNLDQIAKDAFFKGGFDHVTALWELIQRHFDTSFQPKRTLDFGCGVGRITIPLSKRSREVIGVDLSENMLIEARANCRDQEISNIEFMQTDRFLAGSNAFDFIHSFIVLQHIQPDDGLVIVRKMLAELEEGGIGALHFAYAEQSTSFAKFRAAVYQRFPVTLRLRQAVAGQSFSPIIPTYIYDLNLVMGELHKENCHEVVIRFSDHGLLGVLLVFRKGQLPSV